MTGIPIKVVMLYRLNIIPNPKRILALISLLKVLKKLLKLRTSKISKLAWKTVVPIKKIHLKNSPLMTSTPEKLLAKGSSVPLTLHSTRLQALFLQSKRLKSKS